MTIHQFNPLELGFTPCLPDGRIREKFVAVGNTIAIGKFRQHLDLVHALLRGPLANFPQDINAATVFVQENQIPVVFGNILADDSVELLTDPVHDFGAINHHASVVAAVSPCNNRVL